MPHSLELFSLPTLLPLTYLTVTISVCNSDDIARDYLHSDILAIKYETYEGESNENLKSAIKILNTARLSCKLTTVILMV